MTYPCKGILIDPFACSVTEVDLPGPYSCLYPVLSHESMPVDLFTTAYPPWLEDNDCILVDDEGLLKPCDRFFFADGYPQPLAGKGIVLGADDKGETIAPRTSLVTVKARITFLARGGPHLFATTTPWQPPTGNNAK